MAEHGTSWTRWVTELERAGLKTTALIQRSHEAPATFAQRVRERARLLAGRDELPATILFVASRRVDLPTANGRSGIACGLVSALASSSTTRERGRLLLACDRAASPAVHDAMAAMKRAAVAMSERMTSNICVADARPFDRDPNALREPAPAPIRLAAHAPSAPPELPLPAA